MATAAHVYGVWPGALQVTGHSDMLGTEIV